MEKNNGQTIFFPWNGADLGEKVTKAGREALQKMMDDYNLFFNEETMQFEKKK